MRGTTAKALRKAAEYQAEGLLERAYYDTVEKTQVVKDPVTGKLMKVESITTRIEPKTMRAVYKLLKKIKKESNSAS